MLYLKVDVSAQKLLVLQNNILHQSYSISTGKNGVGEQFGSEQTPRGWHIIRAKIGTDCPINTVFIRRRPTGEIFSPKLAQANPNRDWILTRIMWLSGLEVGKNRLGQVDTMRRFIYIHGVPDEAQLGIPLSHGCIRMHSADLIELFENTPIYTRLLIQ
jgi:L,D-transpeptidase YbiS